MVNLQVKVSKHAVQRYRDRLPYLADTSEAEIREVLKDVVVKGRCLRKRPAKSGKAGEYVYKGLHVVAVTNKDGTTYIVTCYGDTAYKNWSYAQRRKRLRRVS